MNVTQLSLFAAIIRLSEKKQIYELELLKNEHLLIAISGNTIF